MLTLHRTEEVQWIRPVEVSKRIREALKAAFPGTRFYVTTSTYAGGASATIKWTHGPSLSEVEAVTRPYAGATFDGMQDLKEYHTSELPTGERFRSGIDFLHHYRSTTEAVREVMRQQTVDFSLTFTNATPWEQQEITRRLQNALTRSVPGARLEALAEQPLTREECCNLLNRGTL